MGQQQLLLIILGVIVVGIAVAVGITMFQDNAVSANRDAVTNDLVNLAARAQQYYRRPTALGGGQGDFSNCTLVQLTSKPSNANGTYALSAPGAASVTLTGTGVETGNDGSQPVEVQMVVYADSMTTTVLN
jgi:Tfp pilus assembly protein PilE